MRLVLEHVPDPVAALKSLSGLLKPAGRIVVIANDFEFHLRTSASVVELDPLYQAYCASRRQDGGDPCIGRRLPVLFAQAGLIVEGFDMEVSHSKLVGDQAFFQAEGVGIPAQLVESEFLDQQVFENMIRSWKQMLKDPNHSIMRPLFVGVARLPLDSDRADALTTPGNSQMSGGVPDQGQESPDYVSASTEMEEILAQQPEGPYRLAGYCLGGTIAFEIARQLQAEGHQVELVALLDTYNFSQIKRPGFISVFSQRFYFHARNLLRTELKRWPSYFASKFQVIRNGELRLLMRATLPWLFGATGKEKTAEKPPILDLNQAAAFAYIPSYYPGTITLVTPKTNYSFFPDEKMGWGELVDDLEIIKLDVLPHAMLEEPGVEKLGQALLGRTEDK